MSWWSYTGQTTPPPPTPDVLAKIRGAMWTARLNLPWGPRPGQDDNCICIDYFECYTPQDQDRIILAYGPQGRGYTHAPMGPIVDAGYHGYLPSTDWRDTIDVYLDAAAKLEQAGIHVIHFLKPDGWDIDQLETLTPLFSTPKAQALMRIVCCAWEPSTETPNRVWKQWLSWQARVFPQAVRLIHLPADWDAPIGGPEDNGKSGGWGWSQVADLLHGWLVQNAGYVDGGTPVPNPTFVRNFTDQFDPEVHWSLANRFMTGGPGDWPTWSAWGPHVPLKVYAGEYAAYANFWHNYPESESRRLGGLALDAGAAGYFDGGPA